MAETEPTKICPLCAETIKAAAKVCPHCRKVQGRGFFMSLNDWTGIGALIFLIAAVYVVIRLVGDGRDFGSSRGKVAVLSTQSDIEVSSSITNEFVFGVMTNASDYAWARVRFEVRFLDESGRLVYLENASDDFTVLAHSDHSFRLLLDNYKSVPKHAECKVLVCSASDPNVWFFDD